MLVIRVTFADGTTEDREDDSPCIGSMLDPALKHPSEERWYLWLDGDRWPLSFCGHNASPLSQWRGWGAWVWRITSGKDEPLAGQWAECRVETCEEQIARLTAERDGAAARANHLEVQKTVYVWKVAELRGLLADEGKRANAEKARADRLARHARAIGQVARITLKGHGYYGFRTARYGEADALRARARRHGGKDGESK